LGGVFLNFENIVFYKPAKTLSISLTGNSCSLNCSHCGGHYLSAMTDINTFISNIDKYKSHTSILISGGCNQYGTISLKPHISNLEKIVDEGFKLNFHTGIADNESVQVIEELTLRSKIGNEFRVSYDFIVDDETINSVYGTNRTGTDYIEGYKRLNKKLKVVPHVCIGLNGGKIKGEIEALEVLSKENCERLVLIIFIPTKNTVFEKCKPPSLEEIEKIFREAKRLFDGRIVQLGCMRPIGKYRAQIDSLAIDCGINHIVMPSREVVERSKDMGIKIEFKEECCVL
jgi:uncharacterized radical SAM superfamily protein